MIDIDGKTILCEFCNCMNDAAYTEKYGSEIIHLCEEHCLDDQTGYCGLNCKLGYGCDQSC
jgi:hypothetical protein